MPPVTPQRTDRYGDYAIDAMLSESETAWVYQASHPQAKRVALKVLKPTADAFSVLRLYHHARQTLWPAHPGIVRTIEVAEIGGAHVMAAELIEGKDLWKLSTRVDGFDLETTTRAMIELAYALDTVHAAGMVHRAVTPDHLFLEAEGRLRLLNLGYCYGQESGKHYRNRPLRNDWALAPEARDYNRKVTTLADVYSLGAVTLFMLSSVRLSGQVDQIGVRRGLERIAATTSPERTEKLAALLTGCLSPRRRDRPRSAWDFANQLSQAVGVDLSAIWQTPPLAAKAEVTHAVEPSWYVMTHNRQGKSRLLRGTWTQVARSLLHGRLVGHELASQGLGQAFRPLSEFADFARLLPSKSAAS